MKKTGVALFYLLFASRVSFAGGEVGNGGNGVFCTGLFDVTISSQLLDYYQYQDNFTYELGKPELTPEKKVQFVLNRLSKLDPVRAKNYEAEARVFLQVTRFVTGALPSVPDSGFVPVPDNCQIKQMAIQYPTNRADGTRYTVTKDLWSLLDSENKAGLMLHEIVYREEIRLGYTDSEKARYYVAAICSTQMDTMDQVTYDNFASITFQPTEGVTFSQENITETVVAGATNSFDMNSFLEYAGNEPIYWSLVPDAPSWISLNETTGILQISPPTGTPGSTTQFNLVAREGQDGPHAAIADLSIVVNQ